MDRVESFRGNLLILFMTTFSAPVTKERGTGRITFDTESVARLTSPL